jgi:hypothetical protein
VAESIRAFISENPDKTVPSSFPTNVTGADMAKVLRERQVKHTEMLRGHNRLHDRWPVLCCES